MDTGNKKPGNEKKIYVAIFGSNELEFLQLILSGWIKNIKLLTIKSCVPHQAVSMIRHVFFLKRYVNESVEEDKTISGLYKGLYYQMGNETLELTLRFYEKEIKNRSGIVAYYNRILHTGKFEAYVKKNISSQIFDLLKDLHIVRLSGIREHKILIIKNPMNEFVVKYMEDKYEVAYRAKWVLPMQGWLSLCIYYRWLFMEFFRRGVAFKKNKKSYKFSRESAMGFSRATLRDDIIVDDARFKKNDILMLEFDPSDPRRKMAFEEAKKRGFDAVSVAELKVNITWNIFNQLWFYFWVPIKTYLNLLIERHEYFSYYMFMFHKQCFPIEVLMNLYNIKCHISSKDWGDIEETIIFNKYGTRSAIFHWSDLTYAPKHILGFVAHNNYFFWGNAHYDYNAANYFIDNKMNTGCIFKRQFRIASENKESARSRVPRLQKDKKIVAFFDTSFSDDMYTYQLLFDYLKIIAVFCKGHKDVNVLLKPKADLNYKMSLSAETRQRYTAIRDELAACSNFIPLGCEFFEETIAISDVCISMGINTPALIALICRKEGLYFDNTGSREHLFAKKYINKIVFEDGDLLIRQIEYILEGKFRCSDIISEEEIRGYDGFTDDNALERIKDSLYELTLS